MPPLASFAPLAALLVVRLRGLPLPRRGAAGTLALAVLLLVFFGTTLHRAWIWQDNLRLYRDTVAKSPDFDAAKTELASALLRKGRAAEAEEVLEGMQGAGSASDYINDDMNLAGALLSRGDLEGARRILIPLLDKNPKKRFEVLQYLIRTNDQRLGKMSDPCADSGHPAGESRLAPGGAAHSARGFYSVPDRQAISHHGG